MTYSKKKALSVVFASATKYKENLMGRTLLFVSVNKHYKTHCIEATFAAENFKHLTGLESKLKPKHFFNLCLDKRLSERDFEMRKNGTTELKLNVLPRIVVADLSARMIGDPYSAHPTIHLDKIAGSTHAYIGFTDVGGKRKHVPKTLINGDIRNASVDVPDRIAAIFRKRIEAKTFEEVVYVSDKVDMSRVKLPEQYSYLYSLLAS